MTERRVYRETFDQDSGGWWGWISNAGGLKPLERGSSTVITRSPWWIDYNHAPPGAGYLHMLMCLSTSGPLGEAEKEASGTNRFLADGFSTDLRETELTVRLRGELRTMGADVLLLIQGGVDGLTSGWLLTSQPIRVDDAWATRTVRMAADERLWTPLGVRQGREDMYGIRPLERVLSDVDVNIMLVMFPLAIEPMGPIDGDPHRLRPERDYPVWRHLLPEGYIEVDEISLAYPEAGPG